MCVSFRAGLGVALEAPRGLGEQFGCHGQAGLRAGEAGVAEIGGEPGQPGLDINAFAVPGDEAADSEGVAEVVQARLPAGRGRVADPGVVAELRERVGESAGRERAAAPVGQECRATGRRARAATKSGRVGEGVTDPLPPQSRACASNALGSSYGRFALALRSRLSMAVPYTGYSELRFPARFPSMALLIRRPPSLGRVPAAPVPRRQQ